MLSRSSPTMWVRSMSCSEVRVRVNDLFSIPQIYGDNMDWPNMVGGNYRSSTFLVNQIIPPTMMTMIPTIKMMSPIDENIVYKVGVVKFIFFYKKPPHKDTTNFWIAQLVY
jgi:hypothetical protein